MTLHEIAGVPSRDLGQALAEFERQFNYPLGPNASFRIDHGEDYTRFFRAIGDAVCFAAESGGRITGTICGAVRPLGMPDGSETRVLYVGDLKIAPGARGGHTLLRLATALDRWGRKRTDAAYAVVMDGTSVTPALYTGRAGLPAFTPVAKVMVLRIAGQGTARVPSGSAEYGALSRGRFHARGGNPGLRSSSEPLVVASAAACGRLEDTRLAKRLIAPDDSELSAAHLTRFAHADPRAAAAVVDIALANLRERGFHALYTAVAVEDLAGLRAALDPWLEVVEAPATVYAAGLPSGRSWNVDTSEI